MYVRNTARGPHRCPFGRTRCKADVHDAPAAGTARSATNRSTSAPRGDKPPTSDNAARPPAGAPPPPRSGACRTWPDWVASVRRGYCKRRHPSCRRIHTQRICGHIHAEHLRLQLYTHTRYIRTYMTGYVRMGIQSGRTRTARPAHKQVGERGAGVHEVPRNTRDDVRELRALLRPQARENALREAKVRRVRRWVVPPREVEDPGDIRDELPPQPRAYT